MKPATEIQSKPPTRIKTNEMIKVTIKEVEVPSKPAVNLASLPTRIANNKHKLPITQKDTVFTLVVILHL